MKNILLIGMLLFAFSSYAQSGKIDLSKDPSKPSSILPKDNATLLKETTEPGDPAGMDLKEKYQTTPSNGTTLTTTNGSLMPANNPSPNINTTLPVMVNTTNQQTNLGNGVKANTYIYHDQEGKSRGSGTSIEFGGKKK